MTAGIEFTELLGYTEEETARWKQWFAGNPSALELPVDIAGAGTVRRLVQHIFMVELYFAHQVLGLSPVDSESLPVGSVEELFQISEEAARKYRKFFAEAKDEDWRATVSLRSRLEIKPSKRKAVAQALTHSMRHWAQLSTHLRQQGLTQDWIHDFLMSEVMI